MEQSTTVVEQLVVLDLPGRLAVWRRLQEELIAETDAGVVCPPARLTERLRRWVVQHDREGRPPSVRAVRRLRDPWSAAPADVPARPEVRVRGVRAVRCDAEQDTAHPDGPSCACNIGPLCRRHHRLKQLLFAKTRTLGSAVLWSGRTGQSWTSPLQLERELWQFGLLPDDDAPLDLRAEDLEPWDVDPDPIDPWGQPRDTTWTLGLLDPYLWAAPTR